MFGFGEYYHANKNGLYESVLSGMLLLGVCYNYAVTYKWHNAIMHVIVLQN